MFFFFNYQKFLQTLMSCRIFDLTDTIELVINLEKRVFENFVDFWLTELLLWTSTSVLTNKQQASRINQNLRNDTFSSAKHASVRTLNTLTWTLNSGGRTHIGWNPKLCINTVSIVTAVCLNFEKPAFFWLVFIEDTRWSAKWIRLAVT